jgi:uncharacterized membrane protein
MSTPTRARERSDISWIWYLAALTVYVGLSLWLKVALLNWIIGPLFPLIVLYVIPTALRRVFGSRGRR